MALAQHDELLESLPCWALFRAASTGATFRPRSSEVVFRARVRDSLGWETINKLCGHNRGFERFLQDIKIDFESKRIHKEEYDAIIPDPQAYIDEKLGK